MDRVLGRLALRRAALAGATLAAVALGAAAMGHILLAGGLDVAEAAMLALFVPLFAAIALFFWTALAGVAVAVAARLRGRPIEALVAPIGAEETALAANDSCAVVVPVCNEDPERVVAGIAAMLASLDREAEGDRFDVFVLSDSSDPAIAAREEAHCRRLAEAWPRRRIVYRRRERNLRRKVGNIEDFCERWGDGYRWMIVLDADSVMEGSVMARLARLMAAHPGIGLIQTLPAPIGGETVFARALQFLFSLCGPLLTAGAAWWQGRDSNYWGHNAILRLDAFRRHCRLPELPGPPPLGGEILSHDYVEAALLRRAGFEVWMLPVEEGSYEELPPNLLAYARRDRRWCQGNLQHLRLLSVPGLPWMSRVHFVLGAFGYLAAALWAAALALGALYAAYVEAVGTNFFPEPESLYPAWPIDRSDESLALFAATMAMLLFPKLAGAALALTSARLRRGFGGAAMLLASLAVEILLAVLIAPILMALHLYFVATILAGRSVAWNPQTRRGNGPTLGGACAATAGIAGAGLAMAGSIAAFAPADLVWAAPVLIGLSASGPIAHLTGRVDLGRRVARLGLFVTPAESAPCRVVEEAVGRTTEPPSPAPTMPRAA